MIETKNILDWMLVVNNKPYILAETIMDNLSTIREHVVDGYNDQAENAIDSIMDDLLETIEYHEWEE